MTQPNTGPNRQQYPHPMQQEQAVGAFWQWWAEKGASALADMFRGGPRQEEILHELNALITQISPHLVFEFASGDSAGLDSEFLFILTAEGVAEYRAPARRWMLSAPEADATWSYSDLRLPGDSFGVMMGDANVSAHDLRFSVHKGATAVDLEVYHPAFTQLRSSSERGEVAPSEEDQPTVEQLGFVLLDIAFGERAVELWMDTIAFTKTPGASATLEDVRGVLDEYDARFSDDNGDMDQWVVFNDEQAGNYYVGRIHPPLKPLAAPLLDVHVRIDVPFEATEKGMPTQEAQHELFDLEDAFEKKIVEHSAHIGPVDHVGKLVAVETFVGTRAFHFYVGGTTGLLEELQQVAEQYRALPADAKISGEAVIDPAWRRVQDLCI
ncbi:DUF695 domain-containing protein [Corynebacterium anserum]|uniref:DUF695 domain-containing protein n=1 Tax=Corynebacterium anserum TaxID=2684406 RepID=A0A7G7YP29_9CORY|nr:DUF695 domain-containing protein [Corynebacterium anserum]MBC2681851.1 DUF695 domain-containing protein [Corynebacterium anserum]QNH96249.1 DUF695 domain-containing protein [Corynebacterium anserum]